jgi:hypothetical protein
LGKAHTNPLGEVPAIPLLPQDVCAFLGILTKSIIHRRRNVRELCLVGADGDPSTAAAVGGWFVARDCVVAADRDLVGGASVFDAGCNGGAAGVVVAEVASDCGGGWGRGCKRGGKPCDWGWKLYCCGVNCGLFKSDTWYGNFIV